jgi:hypothetical protein
MERIESLKSITAGDTRLLGGRKFTKEHEWAEYRARVCRPSGNFNRFEAVQILKRIGTSLPVNELGARWTVELVDHLEMLVAYTNDEDWHQGKPIVWLSVAKIAEKRGISRSQVNRNENRLMKLGAITWVDSGNHKRYGRRNADNNIIKACGVNLMPLAGLIKHLRQQEVMIEDERQSFASFKEQLTVLRRRCRSTIAWLFDQGLQDSIEGLAEEIDAVISTIRVHSKTKVEELKKWIDYLAMMLDKLKLAHDPQDSVIQGADMRPKDSTDATQGSHECDAHIIQNESSSKEDYSIDKVSAKPMSERQEVKSENFKKMLDWPSFVALLDKSVRIAVPVNADWLNIIDCADKIRAEMGVSKDAWGAACQSFGRESAAIVILMIASKHRLGFVENPGGYLREIVSRHRRGAFKIWTMIYGLRDLQKGKRV